MGLGGTLQRLLAWWGLANKFMICLLLNAVYSINCHLSEIFIDSIKTLLMSKVADFGL